MFLGFINRFLPVPTDPTEPSRITQILFDAHSLKFFTLMNKNSTNYIRECWEKEVWLQITLFWRDFIFSVLTLKQKKINTSIKKKEIASYK